LKSSAAARPGRDACNRPRPPARRSRSCRASSCTAPAAKASTARLRQSFRLVDEHPCRLALGGRRGDEELAYFGDEEPSARAGRRLDGRFLRIAVCGLLAKDVHLSFAADHIEALTRGVKEQVVGVPADRQPSNELAGTGVVDEE